MSAFICSDKHVATIVKYFFSNLIPESQQFVADTLKRENLLSVNYRYDETAHFRKCNLSAAKAEDVAKYSPSDILQLVACLDYQSCEHPTYNATYLSLAERLLIAQGACREKATPGLWSI